MLDKSHLFLVVIAGGSGTRFWPKSTSRRPKQLLGFGGEGSPTLLQQTIARFEGWVPLEQRMVVTTRSLESATKEVAGTKVEVLAEPAGRNTAPCIYWAAQVIAKRDPKAVLLVMPSDHFIAAPQKFVRSVQSAAEWASETGDLVTLGIQPSRPETGYGYLKVSNPLGASGARKVEAFVEKPNLDRASEFVRSGNYLWNGGMFVWTAEAVLKAFDEHMPEMKKAWDQSKGDIEKAYSHFTATSIDYGVMEKAKNVVTFPLDCGWDDLGSWTSLESLSTVLNAVRGTNVVTDGEIVALESERNIVDAPNRLVALLGVDDLIVVEQGNSILVAKKTRAQEIKQVVEAVKKIRPEWV
jgi:mannose-1-phosphate guanylyltransferase